MVDEVNAQLPEDKRFAHVGWWLGKRRSFLEEYDRRFPSSPRRKRVRLLTVVGVALVTGLAAVLYSLPR